MVEYAPRPRTSVTLFWEITLAARNLKNGVFDLSRAFGSFGSPEKCRGLLLQSTIPCYEVAFGSLFFRASMCF